MEVLKFKKNILSEIKVSYKPRIPSNERTKVNGSFEVYKKAKDIWENDINYIERVKILLTDRKMSIIGLYNLSKGGIVGSIVDIRVVSAIALNTFASGLILIHNHPSGNMQPSQEDIELKNKLKKALDLFSIEMLDSLIISETAYYSMKDEGIM